MHNEHAHYRKSIKGLVVERITDEVRQRCPIPFKRHIHYMAHLPPSSRYVAGKSPNEARKAYIRLKRNGLEANDD